jgi:integral membrane protein
MSKKLKVDPVVDTLVHLQRLRIAAVVEGTTLLVLVCVAVPIKHLIGLPIVVSIMGPIHGMVFLLYLWMLVNQTYSGGWSKAEVVRLVVGALVPFGALFSISFIKSKQEALLSRWSQ